ncbi:hypothetical protein BYT27DRAFT_7334407 [Phlegmacium glaucopus]|nr:hypothetical protein BYT27DRAFT_7334407 [Phlegmacium glaucopus]
MSDLLPPGHKLEPIVIVLSEDETETISPHTFSCSTIDIQRDYAELCEIPNASSIPSEEILRLLVSQNLAIPLHPEHVLINGALGQQVVRRTDVVESPEPQQLERDVAEVRSSPVQDTAHGHVHVARLPTPDDGDPEGEGPVPERQESPISPPHREPSIPPLQDRVDGDDHLEIYPPFQSMFKQLRDQHNDLRTRIHQTKSAARDTAADVLEVSALIKAEEGKLQEVLKKVRNIVGPRVAKGIDEDVAASVAAGKLVCRDLSVLDAEFNHSNDEDADSSKSKRGGAEGHDKGTGQIHSDPKGKGKAKDNTQSYGSDDSSDEGRTGGNTKSSGPRTPNKRKRSAESLSDENIGHQKRSRISSTVSARSPSSPPPSLIEKPSSPLKRAREEFEDGDDGSENEVEKSITIQRSFASSVLEYLGPVSKKARREGSHISDIAGPSLSGSFTSPGTKSHGHSRTGTTDNHAGPSTSSHPPQPTIRHLFPPSQFPRFRPPEPPKQPDEPRAKPLQRDTFRVRANAVTGDCEIFDYELTQEYKDRLTQDHYNIFLQKPVCDFKADLQTMSELDVPRFMFDQHEWRNLEDHTIK